MTMQITRAEIDAALERASTTKHLVFGTGVVNDGAHLIQTLFPDRPAMLIADETTFRVAGQDMHDTLVAAGHPVLAPIIFPAVPGLRPDTKNVERIRAELVGVSAPVVPVAVGGGTINDLVKRASFEAGLPYVVVGTAASMDGYTSSGAALIHNGVKQTIACPAPVAVIADLDVIVNAPKPMTASGYGDLVGKITAGADWLIADALGIEPLIPDVWDLVQGPLKEMIADSERFQQGDPAAMEQLFYGLVITGLAIQFAGSTRPASGSEHQFSHLWEMRGLEYEGEFVSHGFKVGLGSIFSTVLYERLLDRDLTALDVDAIVANWPSWDEEEREISALDEHPSLIGRALEECRAKYIPADVLRERLELLKTQWPDLRGKLRDQLMPVDELRSLLANGGCPVRPEQIGLTVEQMKASYAEARLIRKRYTVYDLAYETGIFDELVDELFVPGGYWAAVPAV